MGKANKLCCRKCLNPLLARLAIFKFAFGIEFGLFKNNYTQTEYFLPLLPPFTIKCQFDIGPSY